MSAREWLLAAPSPRPWYFDGRDIFSTGPTDETGGHRLVVPLPNTLHPSQRVSDADAELIVRAVNAYDALVAAAEPLSRLRLRHSSACPLTHEGSCACGVAEIERLIEVARDR